MPVIGLAKSLFGKSRVENRTEVLFAATIIALGVVHMPVKSIAQSAQVIVMSCKWNKNPSQQMSLTIDLARRTVDGWPMTQVTQEFVNWSVTTGDTRSLNRYTGQLIITDLGLVNSWTCQKAQKQF